MDVEQSSNSEVSTARLAQSVERKALNLVIVGSSPTVGAFSEQSGPAALNLAVSVR